MKKFLFWAELAGVIIAVALSVIYIYHPTLWPWERKPMTYDDSIRAIMEGDTDILNHSRIPPEDTLPQPRIKSYHDYDQGQNPPPAKNDQELKRKI